MEKDSESKRWLEAMIDIPVWINTVYLLFRLPSLFALV